MENFFISCPMGFEKTVWEEISQKWSFYNDATLPYPQFLLGGIEIDCPLEAGLSLNHFVKTINRVLLRIKSQKCRDTPKLFNIISKIPWKNFLKREDVIWHISSTGSRLFNTNKIEKACNDGLKKYFNANQLSTLMKQQKDNYFRQNIYLRFENDLLTLSIDTTGELLHLRGNDPFRGHASLRSTLACCLLWNLIKDQKDFTLIDPMCGTGTFLKETLNFFQDSSRTFAYQDWHDRLSLPKTDKVLSFKKLIGFDIDEKVISQNRTLNLPIEYATKDVFQHSTPDHLNTIIICNPPYGKRIKLNKPRQQYFQELLDNLRQQYKPKRMGLLIPSDIKLNIKGQKLKVFNGGIWLNFYII